MSSRGYVTKEQVCQILGWDATDTVLGAEIDALIPLAEDMVDQYCHTRFDREEGVTRTFLSNGTEILTLGYFLDNLTSVELIDYDGNSWGFLDKVMPQPSEPRYGKYRWLLRYDGETFKDNFTVKVTGDWGWTNDTRPSQISAATAFVVKMIFDIRNIDEFTTMESGSGRMIQTSKTVDIYIPFISRALLGDFKNSRWFG